jgi:hypothetical protein
MIRKTLIAAMLAVLSASAVAAVSPDEAAQLGKSLTPVGAEKAGNKDGTIPEWTGGLTTPPAAFKAGMTARPDPYAADKPRLVITGKNADQYKDQLTAVTYALLKRHADFRVDVYPTHRPVTFPKALLDNTAKNAVQAKSRSDGLGVEGARPGVPFPVPKSGFEVMWNHLVRYQGKAWEGKFDSFNVDSSGVATLSGSGLTYSEWPLYADKNLDTVAKGTDPYWYYKVEYTGPARRAGESLLVNEYLNALDQPRKAWQYLPGQRRVKLAPDISYDTPNPGTAGGTTYDDAFLFNGAMDRYDMKLVGKREMIVPYNAYKLTYAPGSKENLFKPKFVNPDLMRWELHRVWVVEATLRPGKRHIYHKRIFYVDEDSWTALAADQYDARGQLFRGGFAPVTFAYDALAVPTATQNYHDLIGDRYVLAGNVGLYYGIRFKDGYPARDWTPDALAGAGIR